jgi:hypothetical protein
VKPPHGEGTTLAEPAAILDRDSATPVSGDGGEPACMPPLYVRALDAFEAFYRQLGVVSQRMAELRAAFDAKPIPYVVLAAADLNSALDVLYARLELLEVITNDDAGRDLWTHPMMEVMRSQLRALLGDGTAYALRHPEDWRAVRQLRRLAITLAADAKLAREVVGGARTSDEPAGDITAGRTDPGQRRDPP